MFDILFAEDALVAPLTLTVLGILLDRDNIIFISLAASKLSHKH
jgi:predicted tellurium resistance membrane protein TerC